MYELNLVHNSMYQMPQIIILLLTDVCKNPMCIRRDFLVTRVCPQVIRAPVLMSCKAVEHLADPTLNSNTANQDDATGDLNLDPDEYVKAAFYPTIMDNHHAMSDCKSDIDVEKVLQNNRESRPGGSAQLKRELAGLSVLRDTLEVDFKGVEASWLSTLLVHGHVYWRTKDDATLWCLGHDIGMGLAVELTKHVLSNTPGDIKIVYTLPHIDSVDDFNKKIQKMFVYDPLVPGYKSIPCDVVPPTCLPPHLKKHGLAFLQTGDVEEMLHDSVLHGHPQNKVHLQCLCKLLQIQDSAKVQPGCKNLTKMSWAECLVNSVLKNETEHVREMALTHWGARNRKHTICKEDVGLLKTALKVIDPSEVKQWEDLEEEVEHEILDTYFPKGKDPQSRNSCEERHLRGDGTAKAFKKIVPSLGKRYKTFICHQQSRRAFNGYYWGGLIQESKSKRYTSYTGLTEYEAFAFIITWLWDCSDARGDKHANRRPSNEQIRVVFDEGMAEALEPASVAATPLGSGAASASKTKISEQEKEAREAEKAMQKALKEEQRKAREDARNEAKMQKEENAKKKKEEDAIRRQEEKQQKEEEKKKRKEEEAKRKEEEKKKTEEDAKKKPKAQAKKTTAGKG